MRLQGFSFDVTTWADVEPVEQSAQQGRAFWRTRMFGDIRVRMVEYEPGYVSDHWCQKGHVLFCVSGELHTELQDGRRLTLTPGMSYQVADDAEPHRSFAPQGAKLFIVD